MSAVSTNSEKVGFLNLIIIVLSVYVLAALIVDNPITTEGRIIGVLLMLVGVGLFGTFTAYAASWFTTGNTPKPEEEKKA
jgi:hypothetical protein